MPRRTVSSCADCSGSRGPTLKLLSFLNWIALGIGALMTLLYAVVCLMMWPYPQLVADAGGGFDHVVQITLVTAIFTAAAALSTWLVQKRHPALWLGQGVLLVALIGVIVFAVTQR
jgi:hypothetical protein|tara:strand:+ start:136 stop:483 length:348 start_codon:yes stop_codon:yes gene_type:complete